MKKLTLILVGAFALMTVSSCKKDWTCTCSYTGLGTVSYPITNATKSDADKACTAYNVGGYSCSLN